MIWHWFSSSFSFELSHLPGSMKTAFSSHIEKNKTKNVVHLLSSSVLTMIGALTFPPPLTVDANTVML